MVFSMKKKWFELGLVTLLAIVTHVLFWDGHLDMTLAQLFFRSSPLDEDWPFQKFWLWQWLYDFGYPSTIAGVIIALVLFVRDWLKKSTYNLRLRAMYFLLVIALGPGLIVNAVLKEHWGRPRPREVVEFNGQYAYQPPLVLSNNGKHSFVCGHCSVSFMFFSFYFILQKGRTLALLLTIAYGFLMGIARMAAGGHFVSDVLWSGYVVFLLCWLLYYFVFREFKNLRSTEWS